jgi:hypothetical protein
METLAQGHTNDRERRATKKKRISEERIEMLTIKLSYVHHFCRPSNTDMLLNSLPLFLQGRMPNTAEAGE